MLGTNNYNIAEIPAKKIVQFSIVIFLYIFNIKFIGYEWLPTGRVVLIVLLLIFIGKTIFFFKQEFYNSPLFYLSLLAVFCWTLIQLAFISEADYGMLSRLLVFSAYSLIMAAIYYYYFKDIKVFLVAVSTACLVQAIIVYVSYISPEYRQWLSEMLVQSGNIPLTYAYRVPGFSNSSGSSLSLTLSLGIFSFMSLFYLSSSLFMKSIFFIASLFILSSCVLVGKLGLFLGVYFFIVILFFSGMRSNYSMLFFILFVFLVACSIFMMSTSVEVAYPLKRSFNFLNDTGDKTISTLIGMGIPEINEKTFFGLGGSLAEDGQNASGSDVGYIQSYYGYGLVFSFVFYSSFFLYIVKNILVIRVRDYRLLAWVLFIPLFIIELKEPFIFKFVYPVILLSVIYLSRRPFQMSRDREKSFVLFSN